MERRSILKMLAALPATAAARFGLTGMEPAGAAVPEPPAQEGEAEFPIRGLWGLRDWQVDAEWLSERELQVWRVWRGRGEDCLDSVYTPRLLHMGDLLTIRDDARGALNIELRDPKWASFWYSTDRGDVSGFLRPLWSAWREPVGVSYIDSGGEFLCCPAGSGALEMAPRRPIP